MDWEYVAKIFGAISAILLTWKALKDYSQRRRAIERIKLSIEIFNEMPNDWQIKQQVKNHIEAELALTFYETSISLNKERRQERIIDIIVKAIFFLLGAVSLLIGIYFLLREKTLWSILFLSFGVGAICSAFGYVPPELRHLLEENSKEDVQSSKKSPAE